MNEKKENNMNYQTNIKTSRNEDISFLQLSYGNFVSLDDYMLLKKENQQLKGNDQVMQEEIAKTWAKLDKKEEIINKAKQYIKNNSHKTEWGDLEQDNESIDINDDVTDTEFITDLLEIYESISEASRKTGIAITSISYCANGKRKTGGGFIWHFV